MINEMRNEINKFRNFINEQDNTELTLKIIKSEGEIVSYSKII